MAAQFAYQAQQFSQDVTIYTHGSTSLATQLEPVVAAHSTRTGTGSITVEPRRIIQLIKEPTANTVTLVFEDGAKETRGFLVHKARTVVHGPFAEQLGLELTPMGDIKIGQPFPETSVQGCFAVGDCASMLKTVVGAVSAGMAAAAGISIQLLA
jgi:gliotoxin/aspirochlorine biosynthesis thioredoxin reductase